MSASYKWIISSNTNPSLLNLKWASPGHCFVKNIGIEKFNWRVEYYPNGNSKKHAGNSCVWIILESKPSNITSVFIKCKVRWIQLQQNSSCYQIVKSNDCIILNNKLAKISKLKTKKLNMTIGITMFEMYQHNISNNCVITTNNVPKTDAKMILAVRMEFIAKCLQQFDLLQLPIYYSKYFMDNIKCMHKGTLEKLISDFNNIFDTQTVGNHIVVFSKIYKQDHDEKLNDSVQVSDEHFIGGHWYSNSMEMRKKMQFIAYNVQKFGLSQLPNYYFKYFKCNIRADYKGKLKNLVLYFSDFFVIETDDNCNQMFVISKIYQKNNESKINNHIIETNDLDIDSDTLSDNNENIMKARGDNESDEDESSTNVFLECEENDDNKDMSDENKSKEQVSIFESDEVVVDENKKDKGDNDNKKLDLNENEL
eukprot:278545_1